MIDPIVLFHDPTLSPRRGRALGTKLGAKLGAKLGTAPKPRDHRDRYLES